MQNDYINYIKAIRKEKLVPQKEMAYVLDISQPQYSRYETCKDKMPFDHFLQVCKYLNISVDRMLYNLN